jgi:hypothetical protein
MLQIGQTYFPARVQALVYAEFQLRPLRIRQKVREVPCYKNWEGLRASVKKLSDNVIETHTDEPDVESIWKDLVEGLQVG